MDNVSKKGRKDAWKEERKKGWMDGRTDEYQGTKKAWVEGWMD